MAMCEKGLEYEKIEQYNMQWDTWNILFPDPAMWDMTELGKNKVWIQWQAPVGEWGTKKPCIQNFQFLGGFIWPIKFCIWKGPMAVYRSRVEDKQDKKLWVGGRNRLWVAQKTMAPTMILPSSYDPWKKKEKAWDWFVVEWAWVQAQNRWQLHCCHIQGRS